MPRKKKTPVVTPAIDLPKEFLEKLIPGPMDAAGVEAVFQQLKKAVIERALGAELGLHLADVEGGSGNHRNGRSGKTVLTDEGPLRIDVLKHRTTPRESAVLILVGVLDDVAAESDGPAPDGPAAVHTPTGVLPVVFSRDEDLTRSRIPFSLALPTVLTAALSLALGLGAQGLWLVSDTAAQGLTDTHAYVEAVIGR